MKIIIVTEILLFLLNSISVVAENDSTEGRITEHNVVSIVALSGILILAHLARKNRKNNSDN